MAEILHEFTAGTKAKASEINDNFAFVRKEMVELNNETSSFLNEELRTFKEGIISDLEATAETKLNKDLSNIEDESKNTLVNWGFPKWEEREERTVNTVYKAEKAGFVYFVDDGSTGGFSFSFSADGETFIEYKVKVSNPDTGRDNFCNLFPVAKGYSYKTEGQAKKYYYFIPCIGG